MNKIFFLKLSFSLAIGFFGGLIFYFLKMPLPWMLGSIIFCLISAIFKFPITSPKKIRPFFVIVIGTLLGSGFTSDLLSQILQISISLSLLLVHLFVCSLIIIPYYVFIGKLDLRTAFFASMPGGLNEMTLISEEQGADDRKVALAHVVRIFFVVITVAFWFRVIEGITIIQPITSEKMIFEYPISELFYLFIAGFLGYYFAEKINLPAKFLLGPMIISGLFYSFGILQSSPPQELVIIAQVVMGTAIGCRFIGLETNEIFRSMFLGVGATLIMLFFTIVFAYLSYIYFENKFLEVILAFSPGGIAEMGIIAYSINADIAYVAAHQVFRLSMIVLFVPIMFSFYKKITNKSS